MRAYFFISIRLLQVKCLFVAFIFAAILSLTLPRDFIFFQIVFTFLPSFRFFSTLWSVRSGLFDFLHFFNVFGCVHPLFAVWQPCSVTAGVVAGSQMFRICGLAFGSHLSALDATI